VSEPQQPQALHQPPAPQGEPAVYLTEDNLLGSERSQLMAFVHDNRTEVVALLEGLSEEQARARLVPSATTVLGIVKHCAFVERVWFHVSLAGRSRAEVGIPEGAEESWVLEDGDTIASVLADYRTAWAEADALAAPYDLDDLAVHNRRGPLTLRWIYAHMVEELSRHAGHGDILREQVLAAG
jgi:uncharacterized damage-inducible protein DinB